MVKEMCQYNLLFNINDKNFTLFICFLNLFVKKQTDFATIFFLASKLERHIKHHKMQQNLHFMVL